jgi:F0F1-type ATP synthase membrane subunit b/b'
MSKEDAAALARDIREITEQVKAEREAMKKKVDGMREDAKRALRGDSDD